MDGGEELEIGGWKHQVVKDGEWAGWVQYGSDPFEDHAGPFYYRVDETGQRVCAMRAEQHHMNGGGFMHGGAIMTFADALGAVGAFAALPKGAAGTITVESKTNFLGAAPAGSVVKGRATPLSTGKRISVWQTEILRDDGKRVAVVTQTQLVL